VKVFLIGAGPGDPGLLTLRGRDVLSTADVVVYDALANPALLEHVRPDAEIVYVGKIADDHAMPQEQINALLVRKASEGKTVARLKGGDPYIFGRGGEEAEALVRADIPFETVPGVSSTVAAPACAGIPVTHRDACSSVVFVTGHENPEKGGSVHDWDALARSGSTLVFVMGMRNLPSIARNLIQAGLDPATPAAVIHRGTTPRQRSCVAPLADIAEEARRTSCTNPSVVVVGKVVALRDSLNWFERRPLFGRSIVVTRAREQASGLAADLSALGAEVVQFPTIEIVPLDDTTELDRAAENCGGYAWVIFTSVNGVRHFWSSLGKAGKDGRALAGCKVAAIGPATAEELARKGIVADLVPPAYVAESVVEALLAREGSSIAGMRILLPRAEKARDVLPEELEAAGAKVDVVPAYRTVPATARREEFLARLEEGAIDCVTFTSSSTVENFFSMVEPESIRSRPEILLAAIGPVTAKKLGDYGLTCGLMPDKFTIPALVEALTGHFSGKPRR
jgi:uroporphyrinogen III methyltransferase/synthase